MEYFILSYNCTNYVVKKENIIEVYNLKYNLYFC